MDSDNSTEHQSGGHGALTARSDTRPSTTTGAVDSAEKRTAGEVVNRGPEPSVEEAETLADKYDTEEIVDLRMCSTKGRGRSFVWTEGLFLLDQSKQPVCVICRQRVSAGNGAGNSNTTNLMNHYKSKKTPNHSEHLKKIEEARLSHEQKGMRNELTRLPPQSKLTPVLKSSVPARVFDDLLHWVIMAQQPLQALEHLLLRRAFQTATGNPGFNYGGPEKFRAALMKKKETATKNLRDILKGMSPAVTIETWTSSSNVGFLAMTVHYVKTFSSEWMVQKGICACEMFDGAHTGARIGAKVMEMLTSLGIEKSVVSVTSSATANMKNAIEKHTPLSISWVGCAVHKMERTVQRYVSDPSLQKTLNVFIRAAAHLHQSTESQENFEAAQVARAKDKPPKRIPLGCLTRWWSWWGLLSLCLEHRESLMSTFEVANSRPRGAGIYITNEDWVNAAEVAKMLAPFNEAVQTLEGDHVTLPLVPCVMGVLNSHIETEGAAFLDGTLFSTASQAMLDDHAGRWDQVPSAVMIAATLSARTKGLDWLDDRERTIWRERVLFRCRELFKADIANEMGGGAGGADIDSVPEVPTEVERDGQPAAKRKRSWVAKCIQNQKTVGASGGMEGSEMNPWVTWNGGGAGNNPMLANLSLEGRMAGAKSELLRFLSAKGLDEEDSGDSDLGWWCRHQFIFPTLARLASIYLAIPASVATPERIPSEGSPVVTERRRQLGDDTADALVLLRGSHGLAWSTGLPGAAIGGAQFG